MPPAPDLSLQSYIPAHQQATATSTVSSPVPMYTAPFNTKDPPDSTFTLGVVQTPTTSPTSIAPYSASIDWTPGVKFCVFVVSAFICLMLSFIILGIIRKIRDEVRRQRAAEQRLREIEDRRREAVLQLQRLELERHAEDARAWEMLMHQRMTRYTEQVEEAEFQRFCNIPLATDDSAQARERCYYRVENLPGSSQVTGGDKGEREKTEECNKVQEANNATGKNETIALRESAKRGHEASVVEPSYDSSRDETLETSQDSSRTEFDGNSTPLSSDEVLRAVNALGYESISDTQRAKARARALKDLEGR